ncbi:MAG: hypothetical protein ACJAXH_001753 [Colwellia sp.]|jgi:hypothetical protein
MAQVQISDDFAVTKVEILASIAKGSGEGLNLEIKVLASSEANCLITKCIIIKTGP